MAGFRRRTLPIDTPTGSGEVSILDFGDAGRPVDVVFSHGNGFNAMTHRHALEPLGDRLHVVAVDQRGHGRTTLPADPEGRQSWLDLVDDLMAVIGALGIERPVVLAGHSMGSSISVVATPRLEGLVKSLVLFDPVVAPRMLGPDEPLTPSLVKLIDLTNRRRDTFPSREDAIAAYEGRSIFAHWPKQALFDYVEDGFVELDGGGVRLACPPAWEASNFGAQRQPMLELLLSTRVPTRVLKAGVGSTCSADPADPRVKANPLIDIEVVEGATHLLPVERPELVQAALLKAALA